MFLKYLPRKRDLLLTFFLFIGYLSNAQAQKFTISGFVRSESGESLIAASVFVKGVNKGAVTNEYGFYSITLEQGTYQVQVSYLGFQPALVEMQLRKNIKYNFELLSAAITKQ
jgi:hypothetical protein